MKRPTFFISSTIYDFHDLRSSLKYYLESQGCVVLASEYNDFQKPLTPHSYDACLESIKSADYFILLIGSRIGGWYNEPDRVSITQMEYRAAYELQKQGGLKLINFVRQEVWQSKNDRKELAKFLETIEINKTTKEQISNHPSKHLEDADFIISFIEEVGKIKETKDSSKNGIELPQSNWIHVFSEFKDIIDVLSTLPILSTPVEELILKSLIKKEVYVILSKCLVKIKDQVRTPEFSINTFIDKYPLSINERNEESTISVESKDWYKIAMLTIHLPMLKFDPIAIKSALSTPSFIKFDKASGNYEFDKVFDMLHLLIKEIDIIMKIDNSVNYELAINYSRKYQGDPTFIQLPANKLANLIYSLNRWVNIIRLSTALIRHFDDEKQLVIPELKSTSPFKEMQEEIEKEKVTEEEVIKFIKENY